MVRTALLLALACALPACHWLFPHRGSLPAADVSPQDHADRPTGEVAPPLPDGSGPLLDGARAEGGVSSEVRIDLGFAGKGFVRIDGAHKHEDYAAGAAVDGAGRIVVVGMVTVGFTPPSAYNKDLALWRYLADGSPDPSFDGDGMVTYHQGNWDWGRDLALTADGKIIVAGNIDNTYDRPTIWRFLDSGALDTSFGLSAGKTLVQVTSAEVQGTDLAVDPASGDYLLLGNQQDSWLTVARLTPAGALQKSFASVGYLIYKALPTVTGARVRFDAAGKMLVAGRSRPDGAGADTDLTLLRIRADGSVDPGFGTLGRVLHDGATGTTGTEEAAADLELDAQGRIYACGSTQAADQSRLAVWRLLGDGSLDSAFGAKGVVVELAGAASAEASACRLDANGRLVIAGTSSDPAGKPVLTLWRLLPSGALDLSLGGKGFQAVDAFPGEDQHVRSLTLAGSRAIVCGHVGTGSASDAAIWRLLLP
jgi:uncharacterized delta-60 repeat protein